MPVEDAEKYYAVVCDISPSEQLTDNDSEVKAFASLIGLRNRNSFDKVGVDHPESDHRMKLRKWSKAGWRYKTDFVQHALSLCDGTPHVIAGGYVSDNAAIRHIGSAMFERLQGPFQKPSSYSKKGRPRVTLGGYRVDDEPVDPFEVLTDDLIVLGWYAEALAALVKSLIEINDGERCRLDILIDRLPSDTGDRKAVILKHLVADATDGLGNVVGRPERSDHLQRDLYVDNLAGLLRETATGKWEGDDRATKIFRMNRMVLQTDLPEWTPTQT